jgi:hypothetical protein
MRLNNDWAVPFGLEQMVLNLYVWLIYSVVTRI